MFPWLLGGGAAIALLTGLGVYDVTHKVDLAAYNALVVRDATAIANANARVAQIEASASAAVTSAGQAEAAAETKLAALAAKTHGVVHVFVTPKQDADAAASRGCVTYGLVRYLNAAAAGVDPTSVAAPAGQPDDACAPVEASALAGTIADNYATYHAVAAQLDGLQAAVTAEVSNVNGKPAKK